MTVKTNSEGASKLLPGTLTPANKRKTSLKEGEGEINRKVSNTNIHNPWPLETENAEGRKPMTVGWGGEWNK